MKKTLILAFLPALLAFCLPLLARAAEITVKYPVPGASASDSAGQYVANLFRFGLIIAGILAVGMIVYGGIVYMISGSNQAKTGEAKDIIAGALLGLILLLASFLILQTIDPSLTTLEIRLPSVDGDFGGINKDINNSN
ncbi:MAG: hypothetical protein COU85_01715 [Candidatus Portnoybacteria bacterium CG10_big_fil_rev_8_21_14_0_10_44_7]|uniref:DUF4190 domain-containing protein n=1 Tax=Candidatus Portnoybacteria bacterium CG10_big_fil_rev_8_21_14_0_10_44_7 TaxID=1974816 RepID=A0A2M8KIR7_9BACT|nr:MAG: hypothetical protein COU85_01715 [Candidatus Portnoybacteria bacterium CG10_big_fil_rev_8_21_14_0_10_44_7]